MTLLRNRLAPASAPGGHRWPDTDVIVDVDPVLAHELLGIPSGGFVEVLPGDDGHPDTPAMREAEMLELAAAEEAARDADFAQAAAAQSALPANWRPVVAPETVPPEVTADETVPPAAKPTPPARKTTNGRGGRR